MLTTLLYLFNLKILVPTWYIFSILSDVSVLLLSKLRSIHLTYRPKYVTESSRQKLSQRWRIKWGRKGAGTSNNFGIDKTVSCPIWCHLGCGIKSKIFDPKTTNSKEIIVLLILESKVCQKLILAKNMLLTNYSYYFFFN